MKHRIDLKPQCVLNNVKPWHAFCLISLWQGQSKISIKITEATSLIQTLVYTDYVNTVLKSIKKAKDSFKINICGIK